MLAPRKIDVEAKDGHVTLTGTVRTETRRPGPVNWRT